MFSHSLLWAVVVVIVWKLDLQLPMQSVTITTNVVSSNLDHDEVYSIQHYVIKFVIDLWQVGGFLLFPPPITRVARNEDKRSQKKEIEGKKRQEAYFCIICVEMLIIMLVLMYFTSQ